MTSQGRGSLRKIRRALYVQKLIQIMEIKPGTPEYRARAGGLMPLEIRLGQEKESLDGVEWKPGQESNGFFLVLGASGSGKTETLKLIGKELMEHGIPLLVLDFHGDVQVPWLRSELISSGMGSYIGINPMELDSLDANKVGLYDQRMALLDLIARAIPHLSHNQKVMLSNAMARAYQWVGIQDNDPRTWYLPPPTFGHVLAVLNGWLHDDGMKSSRVTIRSCLCAVQALFGHPVFGRQRAVSLEEVLTTGLRLDLSKVPDSIRYIVADTLLRKIFRMLMLHGPIPVAPASDVERFRLFVMIDEAKILSAVTGHSNDSSLILNLLVTEARKYGVGIILASQMSEHFGNEVRANAATWLVMKPMDVAQAKKNAADIQVAPADLLNLEGKGDGFFVSRAERTRKLIRVSKLSVARKDDENESGI